MSKIIHKFVVDLPSLKYEGLITPEEIDQICELAKNSHLWNYKLILKNGMYDNTFIITNTGWEEGTLKFFKLKSINKNIEDIING